MGKSSSRKKKRSDASPLGRTRRKGKTKSKRTRNKSKKLRRRHDSDSYSSDYDPYGSSYSSSEDDHRHRRRSRSLTRSTARGSKKRDRRHSYSSDSSAEPRPSRKRKVSKRNDDSGARKKAHKKKPKRRASVSSTSGGSLSCSTCDSGSKNSGENDFESQRGRSRRREKHRRDAAMGKASAESSRYRPRGTSSCSKCSMSSNDRNEERVVSASNSMRLRSVIMVSDKAEERNLDRDEQKEEILYDNDDYPSSRSNDSNDGGSKKELADQTYVESEMKGQVGSEEFAEAATPNKTGTGVVENSGGGRDQYDASKPSSDVAPSLNTVKGHETVVSDSAADEDLESVLRQRALENLKRFRRIDKGRGVSDRRENNSDLKQIPIVTTESAQMNSPKEDPVVSADTTQIKEDSTSVRRRISTNTTSVDGNIGNKQCEAASARPLSTLRGSVPATDGDLLGGNLIRRGDFAANKPRVTQFTWRRDSARTELTSQELPHPTKEPAQAKPLETKTSANKISANLAKVGTSGDKSGNTEVNKQCGSAATEPSSRSCIKEPPQAKLLETKVTANKISANTAKVGTSGDKSGNNEVNKQCGSAATEPSSSSCTISLLGETNSADKVKDDGKDGPQYEQKTMSVTRGGETIQVSYQVYIPKRAPALARRQLKR
ncbi:uncharacterized protein LOC116212621 [Punica granatum]|nr:uncharacterized protein LOC116212621 [Punica granatum]XP_031403106.1 uncharacterized protein LOC116212621 [Punica granatum]